MTLVKWTPFNPFDEMEKWLDSQNQIQTAFIPSLDIYQDNDNIIVETPLPAIKIEDINISIVDNVLTIEGSQEKKTEVDERSYYRKEVRQGSFHRSVALPTAVLGDQAKAVYENGLLKIIIPKEEKIKPKVIKIEIKR